MLTPDDQRKLSNLGAGRRETCAELVHDHYQTVYRFLFHLTRNVHRAEDLTQETFSAAWERIATFQGRSNLATWLHRIAYTKFIDGQRAEQRSMTLQNRLIGSEFSSADPFETVMAVDEARRLYGALDELAAADRTLLVLHYLQGLSYREMATVMDEPNGTIKWRTREALNCLRIQLGKEVSNHATQKNAERSPIS